MNSFLHRASRLPEVAETWSSLPLARLATRPPPYQEPKTLPMLTTLIYLAMAGWSAAIFRLQGPPAAGCTLSANHSCGIESYFLTCTFRFAFVEYEDRRDADDAYHDMHNKRIGRDDILKIEVSPRRKTRNQTPSC